MKTLACRDMGGNDDFVAKGMTEDEVIMKMQEHMKEMHPEMANMPEDEKMKMMEKSKSMMKDEM